jgi:prepilin-type N-terminal cleavage/methylation domain-containing protein
MKGGIRGRLFSEEGGFTLPEMLVTMTIMIVVLFALYNIFDMSIRVFSFGNNKVEAVENARLGMEKMEREIRTAYPYDKAAGTPDKHLFDAWTSTQIKFGEDLDGNRKIECPPTAPPNCETIAYKVDPTESTHPLQRINSFSGASQPLVEYVDYASHTDTGLKFGYFKSDGTTEVVPGSGNEADIAMVRIELRIRVGNGSQDVTQTLASDVALRNRGS